MEQILFTPSAILSLLTQIDELRDKDIEITESLDNNLQLRIGDSTYNISETDTVELEVDNEVIEEVDDLNEDTYQELQESGNIEIDEILDTDLEADSSTVEGGILSELFKTLAVGGMVRLTSKMLTPKEQKEFDRYTEKHMSKREREAAIRDNVYQFRRR